MCQAILHIEKPIVLFDQDYAFPSAMMSSDQSYINWLLSNAIQLYYIPERELFHFSYFYLGRDPNPITFLPLLDYQVIKMDFIKNSTLSVLTFIKLMIGSGYYFTTTVNEYYLPCKSAYYQRHFEHGIMVYGFNDKKGELYTAGYDATKHFNYQIITYENFEKAFLNTERNTDSTCFKRNAVNYDLDLCLIKELLTDFINSNNTSEKLRMVQNPLTNCYWGIEACRKVGGSGKGFFDRRYFYLLYEYSSLMNIRIKKLAEIVNSFKWSKIIDNMQDIEKQFYVLLSLVLKHNIKPDLEVPFKVKNRLDELTKREQDILSQVISIL